MGIRRSAVTWLDALLLWTCAGLLSYGKASSPLKSSDESRLISHLTSYYATHGVTTRPVLNASQPVRVGFSLVLIQILEFDIKQQVITSLVWKDYEWTDEFLVWDPNDFGGINRVFLQPNQIWTPQIILYNTLVDRKVEKHEQLMMVWNNGTVMWMPNVIYRSTCPVDVTDFPFDSQVCHLEFGSWAHGESFLYLYNQGPAGINLDEYSTNVEWSLVTTRVESRSVFYPKLHDTYKTLRYEMTLKRNSGLWVRLMLLPMILLSVISCVVFWIPPNRPDRTTISMSLFTSFFLLLLLIVQSAPPTTATRLVTCCTLNIAMVALAMILSVINVNLYMGRGDCTMNFKDICRCLFGGGCCKSEEHLPREVNATSQSLAMTTGQPKPSMGGGGPGDLQRLTRRQRLALALDTVFFILFLVNLVVIILIMFPYFT